MKLTGFSWRTAITPRRTTAEGRGSVSGMPGNPHAPFDPEFDSS